MIEKKNERKIGSRYIMQMKKFFGPQDIWLEYAEKELRDKGGGNNGFQKNNGGKTKEVKKEHSKYDEGFVTG